MRNEESSKEAIIKAISRRTAVTNGTRTLSSERLKVTGGVGVCVCGFTMTAGAAEGLLVTVVLRDKRGEKETM